MKRRVIKKNINRFITPLIKDLPKIQTYGAVEDVESPNDGLMTRYVYERQHTIINGAEKTDVVRGFRCENLLLNIRRTAETVIAIIDSHDHVFLRLGPQITGNKVRMRLITE